jgi:hypothetical protein
MKRRKQRVLGLMGLWILGTLALLGCGDKVRLEQVSTAEDQAVARGYLEALRQRDFEAVERDTDESLRGPGLRASLEKLADRFPPGAPLSEQLVGANRIDSEQGTTVVSTFELQFERGWVIAAASVREKDGVRRLVGFQVEPSQQSLAELHRFTFAGKGVVHYLVVLAAAGVLGFTLWTFVVYLRTDVPGWKWLWAPFILLGIGKFTLSWTTGQLVFDPVAVQILSVGIASKVHGPWLVQFSVPLGAIVFLNQRRSWNRPPPELPRIATS